MHPAVPVLRWGRSRSVDQPQDFLEQFPRDRDLGHPKRDVTAVADGLRAGLDEFLLQARQRLLLDRLERRHRPQEIAGIIGESVKMETNGAGMSG
jgi:hypothetical protein